MAMKILLVGEDTSYLCGLGLDLVLHGHAVKTVNDATQIEAALAQFEPDAVILDHIEPIDLFDLNPRDYGYEGPLVILVSDGVPEELLGQLHAPGLIKKPFVFESLSSTINLLLAH